MDVYSVFLCRLITETSQKAKKQMLLSNGPNNCKKQRAQDFIPLVLTRYKAAEYNFYSS